jgi:basic amino acid/polyamine antiporter, APA family
MLPPMPEPSPQPARVLGPFDATCIVIGAIIGVGIFFTPSKIVDLSGSGGVALLTWSIGGLIALCGALTFAELGARYHGNGAQYEILRDAYGPLPGFLYVFCNATAIQAGVLGIIALFCAKNLGVAVGPGEPTGWWLMAIAMGLIIVLTGANIAGVRTGSGIQNLTVCAKVLALMAIVALAAFGAAPAPEAKPIAGAQTSVLAAVLAGLVPVFFSYGGCQHALWISGEIREPRRNLPRAIVVGVGLVIVAYLLANWAYLRLLGVSGVAGTKTLAADAVGAVFPGAGKRIVAAALSVSALGILNAQLLSGPRLVYGMARDGRFFSVFGRLSPQLGTPVAAIALLGLMGLILLFAAGENGIDTLLNGVMVIDGLFIGMTGAALLLLRRRQGPAASFRTPGFPLIPLVFVIGEMGVVAGTFVDETLRGAAYIGAIWIVAAGILYLVRFRGPRSPLPVGVDRLNEP